MTEDKQDRRGSPKGAATQPPHVPTDKMRILVKNLKAYGTKHTDIANMLEISHDTLTRHYAQELETGAPIANSRVAEALYKKAIGGCVASMQYWLSRRAGWKETTVQEHTGKDGEAIKHDLTVTGLPETDKWIAGLASGGTQTPPKVVGEE